MRSLLLLSMLVASTLAMYTNKDATQSALQITTAPGENDVSAKMAPGGAQAPLLKGPYGGGGDMTEGAKYGSSCGYGSSTPYGPGTELDCGALTVQYHMQETIHDCAEIKMYGLCTNVTFAAVTIKLCPQTCASPPPPPPPPPPLAATIATTAVGTTPGFPFRAVTSALGSLVWPYCTTSFAKVTTFGGEKVLELKNENVWPKQKDAIDFIFNNGQPMSPGKTYTFTFKVYGTTVYRMSRMLHFFAYSDSQASAYEQCPAAVKTAVNDCQYWKYINWQKTVMPPAGTTPYYGTTDIGVVSGPGGTTSWDSGFCWSFIKPSTCGMKWETLTMTLKFPPGTSKIVGARISTNGWGGGEGSTYIKDVSFS